MPVPGEHKTVQARILKYAQDIGWTYVSRGDAEARRGFDPDGATPEEQARKASLFFGNLLHAQVRAFNPKYKDAEGALIGEFQRFHADIYGNRDFLYNGPQNLDSEISYTWEIKGGGPSGTNAKEVSAFI